MSKAILYCSKNDFEIESQKRKIAEICNKFDMEFISIDVESLDESELKNYHNTPILIMGPYTLKYPFTPTEVKIAVNAYSQRNEPERNKNIQSLRSKNSFGLSLSKYYPIIISFIILLFLGGSVLAPFMAIKGKNNAANALYRFYGIFCHQLAFRSFFIEGEQPYYPRELANIKKVKTYEEEFNDPFLDLQKARAIVGSSISGYKIALCERDVAIYLSLALAGIVFQLSKKKIKSIPWYIWFLIALIPIAIDGFSQLPGLSSGWPTWVPKRESTPFLRVLTGSLFGGGTGWYMFPQMEESLSETRKALLHQRELIKATMNKNRS